MLRMNERGRKNLKKNTSLRYPIRIVSKIPEKCIITPMTIPHIKILKNFQNSKLCE